jgi:REP element-mobilizing transposase RayT
MSVIHKSHNVSELYYHFVFVVKYRKALIDSKIQGDIVESCRFIEKMQAEKKQEIVFVEIGADGDHVHFLLQSVPVLSPSRIASIIKSTTGKHVLFKNPELRSELRKGEWWTDGTYVGSASLYTGENVIRWYVRKQGLSELRVKN